MNYGDILSIYTRADPGFSVGGGGGEDPFWEVLASNVGTFQ